MSDSRLADLRPLAARPRHRVTGPRDAPAATRSTSGCAPGGSNPSAAGVYRVAGAPETWAQRAAGDLPRGRAERLRVLPVGGGAARARRLSAGADTSSRSSAGDRRSSTACRSTRAPCSMLSHFDPRGAIPATSVGADALRPHRGRTALEGRTSGRRGAAAEARDAAVARARSPSASRAAGACVHRRCGTILEHRLPGYDPGESEPERRIAALLVGAGLPEPVRQHRVRLGNRTIRIDLCYPEQQVAIEFDGWEFHSGRTGVRRPIAPGATSSSCSGSPSCTSLTLGRPGDRRHRRRRAAAEHPRVDRHMRPSTPRCSDGAVR